MDKASTNSQLAHTLGEISHSNGWELTAVRCKIQEDAAFEPVLPQGTVIQISPSSVAMS